METYPAAKEKLDAFVKQLREKSPEANADDVRIVGVNSRQWFGVISAVGKDYVLIDQEGATKHRRVLAGSAMARIDLDAEPVHFLLPALFSNWWYRNIHEEAHACAVLLLR